jgi:hypothetical protein
MSTSVRVLPLLFILISGLSCSPRRDSTSFEHYARSMNILSPPIVFSSQDLPQSDTLFHCDSLSRHFKPEFANIVGRIPQDTSFFSIIYTLPTDVGLPILYTYTPKGEPIDTCVLAGQYIVDVGIETRYQTRIDLDGCITIQDTTFSMAVDGNGDPIPGTQSAKVRITRTILGRTGHFKVVRDTIFSCAL